jgi:hypothetical protein
MSVWLCGDAFSLASSREFNCRACNRREHSAGHDHVHHGDTASDIINGGGMPRH